MLSRIADALYWMSRYLERADHTARIMNINCIHMLEAEESLSDDNLWRPLLSIVGSEDAYAERFGDAPMTAGRAVQLMVQDRSNHGALIVSLRRARENARIVRDRISLPMWEAINELWLYARANLEQGRVHDHRLAERLQTVGSEVARFQGLAINTMERGEAFGFYLLGTFSERVDMMARLLDVKYHILLPEHASVGSALDYYQWAALLKSITGFECYRRKYHSEIRPVEVIELVLLDEQFPRSLKFGVERMGQALEQLGPASGEGSHRAIDRLHAQLDTTAEAVMNAGLHEYLETFVGQVADLNAAVHAEYIDPQAGWVACGT